MELHVVILAAGKGSRMKSNLPKVMHEVGNKPMLAHVIDTATELNPAKISVVVGHGSEIVESFVAKNYEQEVVRCVQQKEQLGTGHAVMQAADSISPQEKVLVLYGDVPLIQSNTLETLVNTVSSEDADKAPLGLLTVCLSNPTGYGRILRNEQNQVIGIVEKKDANPEQLNIQEVNTGFMAIPGDFLIEALPKLSNENAQGEFYLTDLVALAEQGGVPILTENPVTATEVEGVNNKLQLANLERCYQRQLAQDLMVAGATLIDPERIDIRGSVQVGMDVFIDANVIFVGDVILQDGVSIGANCIITDSTIGAGSNIQPFTVIEDSVVGSQCNIGPYARLRPNTELKDQAKIGSFVETKKSVVGKGSKVNHLSYVGDAEIGEGVNVGAGTITCNYDGANKYKTVLEDGVFIGSNTALVAPLTVGSGATVGAGSVITKNVENDKLAIARAKQAQISGWERPKKNS